MGGRRERCSSAAVAVGAAASRVTSLEETWILLSLLKTLSQGLWVVRFEE